MVIEKTGNGKKPLGPIEPGILDNKYSRSSLYKDAFKRLKKNKLAILGLAIVLFLIFVAIFAPFLAPYEPNLRIKEDSMLGPSRTYLFGTDLLGRDIFSRVIYGSRISI
ncbi:MAG: ABC transporter permease, partial [Actinomycetia bacterium]|nr:ABC transporter permease [Actinomycetes bacterium]